MELSTTLFRWGPPAIWSPSAAVKPTGIYCTVGYGLPVWAITVWKYGPNKRELWAVEVHQDEMFWWTRWAYNMSTFKLWKFSKAEKISRAAGMLEKDGHASIDFEVVLPASKSNEFFKVGEFKKPVIITGFFPTPEKEALEFYSSFFKEGIVELNLRR